MLTSEYAAIYDDEDYELAITITGDKQKLEYF